MSDPSHATRNLRSGSAILTRLLTPMTTVRPFIPSCRLPSCSCLPLPGLLLLHVRGVSPDGETPLKAVLHRTFARPLPTPMASLTGQWASAAAFNLGLPRIIQCQVSGSCGFCSIHSRLQPDVHKRHLQCVSSLSRQGACMDAPTKLSLEASLWFRGPRKTQW